jgi:hypothetical protein
MTSQHSPDSLTDRRALVSVAVCSLVIIAALVVGVGLASGLILRHVVQTLPLWLSVGLGMRRSRAAGWLALPCFLFWLALMVVIWLFLLDIARVVSGHFTPVEVVMTIVVAGAAIAGLSSSARLWRSVPVAAAIGFALLGTVLQLACFRLSLLPWIEHR